MLGRYHHGDLRAAVLAAAADVIARDGVDQLSLRSLAVELGVSHTAPRHHFGSREGVLTALACEGYELLADALENAASNGDFAAVGVAYVLFAVDHPGHFAVMHRPELVDGADGDLQRAQHARPPSSTLALALMVVDQPRPSRWHPSRHGRWCTVWPPCNSSGALDAAGLPQQAGGDLRSIALRAVHQLFSGVSPNEPTTRREN